MKNNKKMSNVEKFNAIMTVLCNVAIAVALLFVAFISYQLMKIESSKIKYDVVINDNHYTGERISEDKLGDEVKSVAKDVNKKLQSLTKTKLNLINEDATKYDKKSHVIHLYLKDGYEYIPDYKYKYAVAVDSKHDSRYAADYSNSQLYQSQGLYNGTLTPDYKFVDEYYIKYDYYDINGKLTDSSVSEVSELAYRRYKSGDTTYKNASAIKHGDVYYQLKEVD